MQISAPGAGQLNAVLALIELAKDPKKIEKNVKALKAATAEHDKAASEAHSTVATAKELQAVAGNMVDEAQAAHTKAAKALAEAGVVLADAEEKGKIASDALSAVDKKAQKATKVLDERELLLIDREKKLDSDTKTLHERIDALEAEKKQLSADIVRANALAESTLLS